MTVETIPGEFLAVTEFLDHDHPVVTEFVARELAGRWGTPKENAVTLYYAVRDKLNYEVYSADLSRAGLRASAVIARGQGFCVHKSIVYAAVCRAAGVPSRIVLTDVRNHLASPRLRELVGGDVFRFHALNSVCLDGRWVRNTPVFNKMLCRLYGIAPLEFDGVEDSVSHPYDLQGRRYMEFLGEHGEFADFPYELVVPGIRAAHPRLFAGEHATTGGSLVVEAGDSREA
ncbi:transglutaminase domain-containing protein [Nonomuraea sp. MG754425]|uniref:transglutaminase-like domain-containing protein n=1 Tax=Nonomuraea sp. MG754425 TaxID=2570319 RepID=UPI001F410EA3|nr:transglutaminase-like domain-containing protein [Nonomuraea sp. MG754425]MCF6469988.1 transglutaminase domain-containing protein [Nonomuraea sp. MG754425]